MSLLSELIAQLRSLVEQSGEVQKALGGARDQLEAAASQMEAATQDSTNELVPEGLASLASAVQMLDEAGALLAAGSEGIDAYVSGPLLGGSSEGGNAGASAPSGSAPALTGSAQSWADLAGFRQRNGMPAAGSATDQHTAAQLEIAGQKFQGRNAHKRTIDIKANAQTKTHAEADVFQQVKDAGIKVKEAVLYVDRDFCRSCGTNGGVGSLMRGVGIERLIVHNPSGRFVIDATKRPSVPTPL